MNWRTTALSAAVIAAAVLVWEFSSPLLDRFGLGDFDPLTRICLVIFMLSIIEAALTRWVSH